MRPHMPCQHHQDTHKQETTDTPPKVPFKCHRNTSKIPRKHNITHLRNRDWYTAGFAPIHHRHSTKTPPNHHWHTTNTPPRHSWHAEATSSLTNKQQTHIQQQHDKTATGHKGSVHTWRLYTGPTWAQEGVTVRNINPTWLEFCNMSLR